MITLDPIWQPHIQQRVYRALLQAHSFPGRVIDLADSIEEQPAALSVLATLLDNTTTFCDADGVLDSEELLRLDTSAVSANDAEYVLFQAGLAPPEDFAPQLGDVYQPHEGATIVLWGQSIVEGNDAYELTGPGIESSQSLCLLGFAEAWFTQREAWVAGYPMGVDLILCDARHIVALPRTTLLQNSKDHVDATGGRP